MFKEIPRIDQKLSGNPGKGYGIGKGGGEEVPRIIQRFLKIFSEIQT
jgi:hypothetical protein